MIDVSQRNTKCNVFGIDLDLPIAIAPTAMHKMAHFEGEVATAKGIPLLLLTRVSAITKKKD